MIQKYIFSRFSVKIRNKMCKIFILILTKTSLSFFQRHGDLMTEVIKRNIDNLGEEWARQSKQQALKL